MAQKAEAWREYREAAMVEMLLDTLPKVRQLVQLEEVTEMSLIPICFVRTLFVHNSLF